MEFTVLPARKQGKWRGLPCKVVCGDGPRIDHAALSALGAAPGYSGYIYTFMI